MKKCYVPEQSLKEYLVKLLKEKKKNDANKVLLLFPFYEVSIEIVTQLFSKCWRR